MEDDFDDRDTAIDTSITILSALPVVGGLSSAVTKLVWQAWGRRKKRRLESNLELLMRELARREGRQPDDDVWFKERLCDYTVQMATEANFDQLLRARDASARLSIGRLYAAYIAGDDFGWTVFRQYGDFLAMADRHSIRGTQAIAAGLKAVESSQPLTHANISATMHKGKEVFIIQTEKETLFEPLGADIRDVVKAMSRLKRAGICTDAEGGALGNSGPSVISARRDEIKLLRNLVPYLLIDECVMQEILEAVSSSRGSILLETLYRHVDESIHGGVALGELEDAMEALHDAGKIVIETVNNTLLVRLGDPATTLDT